MISDTSSLAEETAEQNLAVPQEKVTLLWGMPPGFTMSVQSSHLKGGMSLKKEGLTCNFVSCEDD